VAVGQKEQFYHVTAIYGASTALLPLVSFNPNVRNDKDTELMFRGLEQRLCMEFFKSIGLKVTLAPKSPPNRAAVALQDTARLRRSDEDSARLIRQLEEQALLKSEALPAKLESKALLQQKKDDRRKAVAESRTRLDELRESRAMAMARKNEMFLQEKGTEVWQEEYNRRKILALKRAKLEQARKKGFENGAK